LSDPLSVEARTLVLRLRRPPGAIFSENQWGPEPIGTGAWAAFAAACSGAHGSGLVIGFGSGYSALS
jgi:hypothetical protein